MRPLVAALPMYDWPETRLEVDRGWASLRDALRSQGVQAPDHLTRSNADLPPVPGGIRDGAGRRLAPDPATLPPNELDLPTLWRHPSLLFAQTCWGPMEQGLEADVRVVGQGDYSGTAGGDGPLYSSAILMRLDRKKEQVSGPPDASGAGVRALLARMRGSRLAFNSRDSMSGFLALGRDLEALGESLRLFSRLIPTGSHRASIIAVAAGEADICTVDCRTWDLAQRFEPCSAELAVVGWTAKRLGLPFVTSRHTSPEVQEVLRSVLRGFRG